MFIFHIKQVSIVSSYYHSETVHLLIFQAFQNLHQMGQEQSLSLILLGMQKSKLMIEKLSHNQVHRHKVHIHSVFYCLALRKSDPRINRFVKQLVFPKLSSKFLTVSIYFFMPMFWSSCECYW